MARDGGAEMVDGPVPKTSRRHPMMPLVIGGYLVVAWGCVLYAWLDPGTYSLNFLLPVVATAPTSLIGVCVAKGLGLWESAGTAAAVLAACGLTQAAALYALLGRRPAEPGAAADGGA